MIFNRKRNALKKDNKTQDEQRRALTEKESTLVNGGGIPRLKIKDIAVKYKFTIDNLT